MVWVGFEKILTLTMPAVCDVLAVDDLHVLGGGSRSVIVRVRSYSGKPEVGLASEHRAVVATLRRLVRTCLRLPGAYTPSLSLAVRARALELRHQAGLRLVVVRSVPQLVSLLLLELFCKQTVANLGIRKCCLPLLLLLLHPFVAELIENARSGSLNWSHLVLLCRCMRSRLEERHLGLFQLLIRPRSCHRLHGRRCRSCHRLLGSIHLSCHRLLGRSYLSCHL